MKLLNSGDSGELRKLALALADAPAKGTTPSRLSAKTLLPIARVRRLLEKNNDYFVNIGGSGFYALNQFGPYKGDSQKIIESIDKEAQAASTRRNAAAVLLVIALLLFVLAR